MLKASRGGSPLDTGAPLVVDAPRVLQGPAITVRSALKKSVYARKLGACHVVRTAHTAACRGVSRPSLTVCSAGAVVGECRLGPWSCRPPQAC